MSNELAQVDTDLSVLPAQRPASPQAVEQLMTHAKAMGAARELAEVMCASELVPAIYRRKPDNGAAAILYGAEIGLNPIQSLQQVFVVHGTPAVYARTMVALLHRHGYVIETLSSTDEAVAVRGTDPRTGRVEEAEWTFERAQKAGYTSNKKYESDPQAMLYAKAATQVCRRLAPEVLLGISQSKEELDLEAREAPVRVPNEASRRGVSGLANALGLAAPAETPETVDQSAPATSDTEPTKEQFKRLNDLFVAAGLTKDDKNGRRIVAAQLVPDRDPDAPLTAANVDHIADMLQQLRDQGDQVLIDTVESLITEHDTEGPAQ
ncbi:RecT-like ssDNA binding protein [Gordonia phage Lysidious]|nr:RecT-like ssDNA binding protein [Gordonia phage Lysidious]